MTEVSPVLVGAALELLPLNAPRSNPPCREEIGAESIVLVWGDDLRVATPTSPEPYLWA